MKFQLYSILIILLSFQNINAQVFKPDWNNFISDKFNLSFTSNVTTYQGLDSLGELHFELKSDAAQHIIYFVFAGEKITEEFESGDANESMQSCVRLHDAVFFTNIFYKKYRYIISPWQNCETASDIRFKGVSEEIMNFILK